MKIVKHDHIHIISISIATSDFEPRVANPILDFSLVIMIMK